MPVIFRYMSRAQAWLYRRTNGRIGGTWRVGATGFRKPLPTLLLQHRGRKSGKLFTIPLLYVVDGPDLVVVASQGGLPNNPQWYHNLVACPDVVAQIGSEVRAVRAVIANASERQRLWPGLVEFYPDFDTYQAWAEREIPVVILQSR